MNLDVTASHASVSLNPFLLGWLKYAMMTVAPVAILFLALGQEQLYRGPDFGQGQFWAKLVPRLPVLLSHSFTGEIHRLGRRAEDCFKGSVRNFLPLAAGFASCRTLDFNGPMSGPWQSVHFEGACL